MSFSVEPGTIGSRRTATSNVMNYAEGEDGEARGGRGETGRERREEETKRAGKGERMREGS